MVHLVINCVETIHVFFQNIAVSGDFPFSLPLLTMIPTIIYNHHALRQIIEATHQNIKNLCCGVSRTKQTLVHSISLPD